MNKKILPFIIVATLLLVLPFVAAAEITNGLLGDVGDTLIEIFTIELKLPHPGYVHQRDSVMLWQVILVFMMIYAIMWAATSYIKMFEKEGLKSSRTMFTIAVTLIMIFGSNSVEMISGWVVTLGNFSIILGLILAIIFIIAFFKRGKADAGELSAQAATLGAQNLNASTNARHAIDLLKNEQRASRNIKNYEKKLFDECKDNKERLETIKKMLLELINIGSGTEKGKEVRQNIANKIVAIMKGIDGEQKFIMRLRELLAYSNNINANLQATFKGYEEDVKKINAEVENLLNTNKGVWPAHVTQKLKNDYQKMHDILTKTENFQTSVSVQLVNRIENSLDILRQESNVFLAEVNEIQKSMNSMMNANSIQDAIGKIDKLIAIDLEKINIIKKLEEEDQTLQALVNADQQKARTLSNSIKTYVNSCKKELQIHK